MDVIILGTYSKTDKKIIDNIASMDDNIRIVWDYDPYNIEAAIGIRVLEEHYKLFQTGILVENDNEVTFSSYPLIYEVSEAFINGKTNPKLFLFFDRLEKSSINNMIIAFADEWKKETTVKVEKCNFSMLKKRLNSIFVWCEGYRNLIRNTEVRDDFHPLILEVGNALV